MIFTSDHFLKSYLYFFAFVILAKQPMPTSLLPACDDGWTLYDGNCYVFNENKVKHPEAVQACEALDAQMTTSTSAEENAFLSGMDAW